MNLLALDTALGRCSVAVWTTDAPEPVLRSRELSRGHAECLGDMIAETMTAAGLAFADLERIAVTVGPGSFTGLRVALSMARGFAVVLPVEVVGITTLAAIAEAVRKASADAGPLAVALSARGGEVYAQLFEDGEAAGEPEAIEAADFAARLAPTTRLAGSGAARLAETRPELAIVDASSAPDIAAVARLGRAAVADGPPVPLYLRAPDAKPPKAGVERQ